MGHLLLSKQVKPPRSPEAGEFLEPAGFSEEPGVWKGGGSEEEVEAERRMEELTKDEGRGYCAEWEEQLRGWISCGWFSGVSVGGSSALSPFGVKYLLAKWKSVHYARLRCQARKRAQGAPVKGPQAPGRAGTGPSVCSQRAQAGPPP